MDGRTARTGFRRSAPRWPPPCAGRSAGRGRCGPRAPAPPPGPDPASAMSSRTGAGAAQSEREAVRRVREDVVDEDVEHVDEIGGVQRHAHRAVGELDPSGRPGPRRARPRTPSAPGRPRRRRTRTRRVDAAGGGHRGRSRRSCAAGGRVRLQPGREVGVGDGLGVQPQRGDGRAQPVREIADRGCAPPTRSSVIRSASWLNASASSAVSAGPARQPARIELAVLEPVRDRGQVGDGRADPPPEAAGDDDRERRSEPTPRPRMLDQARPTPRRSNVVGNGRADDVRALLDVPRARRTLPPCRVTLGEGLAVQRPLHVRVAGHPGRPGRRAPRRPGVSTLVTPDVARRRAPTSAGRLRVAVQAGDQERRRRAPPGPPGRAPGPRPSVRTSRHSGTTNARITADVVAAHQPGDAAAHSVGPRRVGGRVGRRAGRRPRARCAGSAGCRRLAELAPQPGQMDVEVRSAPPYGCCHTSASSSRLVTTSPGARRQRRAAARTRCAPGRAAPSSLAVRARGSTTRSPTTSGRRRSGAAGPAQDRPDPGGDLVDPERLDHVVVGAGVEGADDRLVVVLGGHHDHGYLGDRADHREQLQPVDVRQSEVEQHHVRLASTNELEDGQAGGRRTRRRGRAPAVPGNARRISGSSSTTTTLPWPHAT